MFCLSQVRTQPITLKSLQYSCQGARQYELANRFVTDLADMRWQLDDLRQPVVLASYKSTYPVPQQIVNGALVTAYATSEGLAAPATKNLCKKKLKRWISTRCDTRYAAHDYIDIGWQKQRLHQKIVWKPASQTLTLKIIPGSGSQKLKVIA